MSDRITREIEQSANQPTRAKARKQGWKYELEDVIRGAAGGFLFGIPLLYTMEVWWIGSYSEPGLLLAVLGITYAIVFLLNLTDGFRQEHPDSPKRAAMDSVEALAIGILCTTLILILLREITGDTPLNEAMGKIIFEGVPFALGVALARSILSGDRNSSDAPSDEEQDEAIRRRAIIADVGATLVGAIFIAFNISPTDEIPMLAAATSQIWLVAIVVVSLIISYGIVFVAGLTAQEKRHQQQGLLQHPMIETALSYLVSLGAAAFMLFFFHRLTFTDPWTLWVQQVILLGLPATVGGSAGRIAI